MSDLVNNNLDYISFYVKRKLKREVESEGALNLFAALLGHCNRKAFDSISIIIKDVILVQAPNVLLVVLIMIF